MVLQNSCSSAVSTSPPSSIEASSSSLLPEPPAAVPPPPPPPLAPAPPVNIPSITCRHTPCTVGHVAYVASSGVASSCSEPRRSSGGEARGQTSAHSARSVPSSSSASAMRRCAASARPSPDGVCSAAEPCVASATSGSSSLAKTVAGTARTSEAATS